VASRIRQGTSVIAAAVVLVYVSMAGLTELRNFAVWPASLAWLALAAFVCGFLLALVGEGGAWRIVASSVLAVLLFAGLWNYIFWSFLGEYASFFELGMSNPYLYLVLPRCALILLTTAPLGLLGVVTATILLPDEYRQ
jgi:hypothetical protein